MREVTKEEFFKAIFDGRLDVHPQPQGDYPYTTVWNFPRKYGHPPFGKIVGRIDGGAGYFISEERK